MGVTTPRDLIQDRNHSGFNIGTAVEMEGFTLAEAQPLAAGLVDKVADPQGVLSAVLHWSGGQPFLTQKLLGLVVREVGQGHSPGPDLTTWVGQIAQRRVIENWEAQDTPEHLRTLQDRMLQVNEQQRGRLLGLYQQILLEDGIAADDSYEQTQLRLTGLVVKRQGQLQVYNPVYRAVFNAFWVAQQLGELRPPLYAQALRAWHDSADSDPSFLLRGQALADAETWAKGKRLSSEDELFLQASLQQEKTEQEKELEAERKRNNLLAEANQTADRRIRRADRRNRWSLCFLGFSIVAALGATFWGSCQNRRIMDFKESERNRIIVLTNNLDRQFELLQTQSLITAIQSGEQITKLSKISNMAMISKIFPPSEEDKKTRESVELVANTLRNTLNKIQERQINVRKGNVSSITWIEHDGKTLLVSGGYDGTVRLWSRTGEPMENSSDGAPIILPTQQGGAVWSMSWSDKAKMLATGGHHSTLKLWSLKDGRNSIVNMDLAKSIIAGTEKEKKHAVSKVKWIKNGTYLLTLNTDRKIYYGEPIDGNELKSNQGDFTSFGWSEASEILATGGSDSTVKLWTLDELISGSTHRSIPTRQDGAIGSINWSQDGELFATGGADGSVKLWTKEGGSYNLNYKSQKGFNDENPNNINTGQGIVWWIIWTKDNHTLITGGADGSVKFWNLNDLSKPFIKQSIQTLQGSISGMSLTQDETILATIGTDKTIKLWTLEKEPIDPGADEDLSTLMWKGCDWLSGYLISSPEDLDRLSICQTPELKRAAFYNREPN